MTTTTTPASPTKPCPFCGNVDEVYSGGVTYCDNCGADGPSYYRDGKPVASWNDRAEQPPPACSDTVTTDCRSPEGVAMGLIDGIIATARVLRGMDQTGDAVVAALADLRTDKDVAALLSATARSDKDAERAEIEAAYLAEFGDPKTVDVHNGVELAWLTGPGRMWLAAKSAAKAQESAPSGEGIDLDAEQVLFEAAFPPPKYVSITSAHRYIGSTCQDRNVAEDYQRNWEVWQACARRATAGTTAAPSSEMPEWQIYADYFKVDPEEIDYDGEQWHNFVAGVNAARSTAGAKEES